MCPDDREKLIAKPYDIAASVRLPDGRAAAGDPEGPSPDPITLDYGRPGHDREQSSLATYCWIATAFATCLTLACSIGRTFEPVKIFLLIIFGVAALLMAICVGLAGLVCVLVTLARWYARYRLRRTLGTQRRLIRRSEARQLLQRGKGTLILEQHFHYGHRSWWTPDDVIATSPVELPRAVTEEQLFKSERQFPIALHAYGKLCVLCYTDPRRGSAKRIEPSLFVLAEDPEQWTRFPDAKVVTLISWLRRPLIVAGAFHASAIPQAEFYR